MLGADDMAQSIFFQFNYLVAMRLTDNRISLPFEIQRPETPV